MSLSRTTVIAVLAGLLAGILIAVLYSAHTVQTFTDKTAQDLALLRSGFIAAAHEAASNKVTDESKAVAIDCKDRPRFDDLLTRLRTLTEAERVELDTTFPACAPYQLSLKRFHLARLSHIVEKYNEILTYRGYFMKSDTAAAAIVEAMNAYVAKETVRADLMRTQLELQRDIIDVLHGKKIASGKSLDALAQDGAALNGKFIALQSETEPILKNLEELLR